MTRTEAIAGAVIVGLLLCWGLVAWGAADGLWYLTAGQRERLDNFLATPPPSAMTAQQEPPQPAPDDPHSGQPSHCSNAKNAPAAHKCSCSKEPEDEGGSGCDVEDKKCKVYCRKDHCHCYHHSCDS